MTLLRAMAAASLLVSTPSLGGARTAAYFADHESFDGAPSVRFARIEPQGSKQPFIVALIKDFKVEDPEGKKMARGLLDAANNWVVDQYISRHPQLPREKFEEMRAHGIEIGRGSSMIVVLSNEAQPRILGTLRFAYQDDGGKVPLERDLGWDYPRMTIERRPYQEIDIMRGRLNGTRDYRSLMGDPVEIKNLVVEQGLGLDLVSIMYYFAEFEKLSKNSRKILASDLTAKAKADFETQLHMRIDPAESLSVDPGEYVLRCDAALVPYYRRMGFELVQEKPVAQGDYVMSISREKYVEMAFQFMKGRPGAKVWDESIHDPPVRVRDLISYYNDPKRCSDLLLDRDALPGLDVYRQTLTR